MKLYTLYEADRDAYGWRTREWSHKEPCVTIKPRDIGPPDHTRGWISSDGTTYSGMGEHDSILQTILNPNNADYHFRPDSRSGWVRWIGSYNNNLFLDWSEYGNDKSEALARSIAKQVSYPFDKVWIDAKDENGKWVSWKGSVDDFIKFGTKGRMTQFESISEANAGWITGWEKDSNDLYIHHTGARVTRQYKGEHGWFLIPASLDAKVTKFEPSDSGIIAAFKAYTDSSEYRNWMSHGNPSRNKITLDRDKRFEKALEPILTTPFYTPKQRRQISKERSAQSLKDYGVPDRQFMPNPDFKNVEDYGLTHVKYSNAANQHKKQYGTGARPIEVPILGRKTESISNINNTSKALLTAIGYWQRHFNGERWPALEQAFLNRHWTFTGGMSLYNRARTSLFKYLNNLRQPWPEGDKMANRVISSKNGKRYVIQSPEIQKYIKTKLTMYIDPESEPKFGEFDSDE